MLMCSMRAGMVMMVILVMSMVGANEATKTRPLEETVEVQLKQGVIFAAKEDAGEGRSFYSFKSIPYAQPPVSDLRFRDPVAAGGWSQPRNGSLSPPFCPQTSLGTTMHNTPGMMGSEDCLYLNVYTPSPRASGLPVMVWFHGSHGGNAWFPPLPLLTRDLVLVLVQYRVGILGYLSTEDSVLPGNLGLKDQTLALRWVRDNIRHFGGDPDTVTIFGEAAGAAAAHFHMLSPLSKGLFKRAILQSGTALCPWSMMENHKQVATKLSHLLCCSNAAPSSCALDSTQFLACLQQLPVEKLISALQNLSEWNDWTPLMTPRVDGHLVPDHPATLLRSGKYNKVDLISGITQHGGAFSTAKIILDKKAVDELEQNFTSVGPLSLLLQPGEDSRVYLARRAYYHYLGETKISEEKAEEFTQLVTDNFFRICHEEAAERHTIWGVPLGHKVFKYELQHRGQYSLADLRTRQYNRTLHQNWVGHGDDLMYLFNVKLLPPLERPADLFLRDNMLTLWTNFATTGNPTPDGSLGFRWWPTKESHPWYLALTTSPTMMDDVPVQTLEFWRNLPKKKNKLLYPERFLTNQSCVAV